MDSQAIRPYTLEENLIHWTIAGTWGFWLLGSLYLVGPLLGILLMLVIMRRFLGFAPNEPVLPPRVPVGVLLWIIGMLLMLVALVVAHIDFELGTGQLIKSVIGWGKGWALMAVFPLAGAMLSIRPATIYRATGVLAIQTLVLVPLFILAGMAGLPEVLYVSPLSLVGGPGPEFFDVSLYSIDNTTGKLRWRFFAPWSTAAAFLACIGLIFALNERSRAWKIIAVVSAIVVCWMSGSRAAIVAIPLILFLVLAASNAHRPIVLLGAAVAVTGAVLMADLMLPVLEDMQESFKGARAASSRVRSILNNIGYHRWYSEAPIFGHGILERGSHLVEFMLIGSHHTWYGLLFVKGVVGFAALALPLGWSIVELGLKAQADRVARAGLGVLLLILAFSFADNVEIVAYLVWPGLVLIGICLRRRLCNPFLGRFGAPAPRTWQLAPADLGPAPA